MNTLRSRLGELLFPSNVSLSADFPWDRSVLRTFGVILVALLTVMLSPIIPLIVLFIAGGILSVFVPGLDTLVKSHSMLFGSVLEVFLYAAGFGAAILFLLSRFRGRTLSEITSLSLAPLNNNLKKAVFFGALGYGVATALNYGLYALMPLPEPFDPAGEHGATLSGLAVLFFAFSTMVLAPILEEIVFRGFFFNMLRRSFRNRLSAGAGDLLAVIVSAFIFAAIHGTLTGFPGLFVIGLVLAEVYRRTGSLQTSMWMHFINNTVATFAILLGLNF